MKAYYARIERYLSTKDSWLVDLESLNWQFVHLREHGGRATLEAAIRSTIEEITGDKGFGVVMNFE